MSVRNIRQIFATLIGSAFYALSILLVGVVLSFLAYGFVKNSVENEARLQFENEASDARHKVEVRFGSYTDVMHGLSALFRTSSSVSRTQFHQYITSLNLGARYPGFETINYAEYIPAEKKLEFESRVRRDTSMNPPGYPNFFIHPRGNRPGYHVITYLEPMADNESVLGSDISTNNPPFVLNALEKGRDSGQMTSSGQLLRPHGNNKVIGLAVRLPVYRPNMPLGTIEQRRAAYIGSVGAGFDVRAVMQGVLSDATLKHARLRLYSIGPAGTPATRALLTINNLRFDTHELPDGAAQTDSATDSNAYFQKILGFQMGGRKWAIDISAEKNAYIVPLGRLLPGIALLTGLLMTLLLYIAIYSLSRSRQRAEQIALEITRELRDSEANLAEAQHMAHVGSWLLKPDGKMVWSDETYRILGLIPFKTAPYLEDFLHKVHENDRDELRTLFLGSFSAETRREGEHRIRLSNGSIRWIHSLAQITSHQGQPIVRGISMDITNRKEAALREQAEYAVTRLLATSHSEVDILPDFVETICTKLGWECGTAWITDKSDAMLMHRVATWGSSDAAAPFLKLHREMTLPDDAGMFGNAWGTGEPVWIENLATAPGFQWGGMAAQAGLHCALISMILVNGKPHSVLEFFSRENRVHDEELLLLMKSLGSQLGQYLQRREAEDKLKFVANHDLLTDLPNRAKFSERLRHSLTQATRYKHHLAVLFIDIDRFKIVNDTMGHSAGDRLLQACATRLKFCTRESDTVARLGGDEFVVLVDRLAEPRDATIVAQKILTSLAEPLTIDGQELNISGSIGISAFPDDGTDDETLLKNADIAMYRAKEQGRNNYQFYSVQMNKHSFERLAMESSLRRALERNEFLLHYQPRLDLRTGKLTGMEALIRWQHPEWGMVSPAQFIPLAEETGIIVQIGEWVLRTVCEQLQAWQALKLPSHRVAVNLSARQFTHQHLLSDISQILTESRTDPRLLEFEITESMVMNNPEQATRTMRALKDLGVELSIDDFGTGYSSLAYLKHFPIDCLKLDQSFVKGLPGDPGDVAISKGVIGLAHSLHLKIVAEGVETIEQQQFLLDNDCDEIQGYLFSRPLPAKEITALLSGKTPSETR